MKGKNRWKGILITAFALCCMALICPAAAYAADGDALDFKITDIDASQIIVSLPDDGSGAAASGTGSGAQTGAESGASESQAGGITKIYVDSTVGNSSTVKTESYKIIDGSALIDLQYLTGRKAKLVVYSDAEKTKAVTIEMAAKTKIKASYDKVNEKLLVNSTNADPDKTICIFGNKTASVGSIDFTEYYKKGASGIVYVKGDAITEEITKVSTVKVDAGSKEVKVKIPAQKKGPTIKIDVEKVSFRLPKGCTYDIISTGGISVASDSAVGSAKDIDLTKVLSLAGISLTEPMEAGGSESALIEVYKNATAKALPSKITEVYLPVQRVVTAEGIGGVATSSGITFENVYNKSHLKMTGVKVTNNTQDIYQVAVVGKDITLENVDLLTKDSAKKVKWKTVKPGKSVKYNAKKATDGTHLLYRIKGTKKTKRAALSLPSVIIMDPRSVEIEKAPTKTVSVGLSAAHEGAADTSSSSTSLTVTKADGVAGYVYKVEKKEVKNVKIGTVKADVGGTEISLGSETATTVAVKVKAKQWVVVYAYNDIGEIISFGAKKVNKELMY